jgi:hypothetical protein
MHVYTPGVKRQEIMRGKKIANLYHVKITHATSRFASSALPATPVTPSPVPTSASLPSPSVTSPIVPPECPSTATLPPSSFTPAFAAVAPTHSWDKWHRIFGHISPASVKMLKNHNMVEGMNIDSTSTPSAQCMTCIKAKSHVAPFPAEAECEYAEIGEMTFTDVWGPSRVTGINGERYYISFSDGAKRRTIIYLMKKRTEVLGRIKDYDAYIFTQTGKHVKAFHCDNAKEYISKDVRDYLGSRGIRLELTAPYSPQQNGAAERLNRTLVEHARAMLTAHNVPQFLWPEAIAYATYLKNRSPTRALGDKITPDEAFWGKKPNVAALQEFGTPCEVLRQDGKNSKIGVKTRSCIFVGLSEESRAWRYYNPNTRKVLTSRNITFIHDPTTSDVLPAQGGECVGIHAAIRFN